MEKLTAVVMRDGDMYLVSCPEVSGAHTEGASEQEALENILEATQLMLDVRPIDGITTPTSVDDFNVVHSDTLPE